MDGRTTAMSLSPDGTLLVVVTASKSIYVFDVEKKQLHIWTTLWASKLPRRYKSRTETVSAILFVDNNRFILSSTDFLCLIDISKVIILDFRLCCYFSFFFFVYEGCI
jgi:hypothetical protein